MPILMLIHGTPNTPTVAFNAAPAHRTCTVGTRNTTRTRFLKDPNAELDYTWDWSAWLGTDVIEDIAVTTPAGMTEVSEANNDTAVTVWLSGGTSGTIYEVTCQIMTLAGRVDERTIYLNVQNT